MNGLHFLEWIKRDSGGQHRKGSQLYSGVLHLPSETAAGKILETVGVHRGCHSQIGTVLVTLLFSVLRQIISQCKASVQYDKENTIASQT